MRAFQFIVSDERQPAPSLVMVQTKDELTARLMAERLLEYPDHHRVEVCDGDKSLFVVVADENTPRKHGRRSFATSRARSVSEPKA